MPACPQRLERVLLLDNNDFSGLLDGNREVVQGSASDHHGEGAAGSCVANSAAGSLTNRLGLSLWLQQLAGSFECREYGKFSVNALEFDGIGLLYIDFESGVRVAIGTPASGCGDGAEFPRSVLGGDLTRGGGVNGRGEVCEEHVGE